MKKRAIGIFIDDYTLKIAMVSQTGKAYQVDSLEQFQLYEALGSEDQLDQDLEQIGESAESEDLGFGRDLSTAKTTETTGISETRTNLDVIIDIFRRVIPSGTQIAFTIGDSFTLYKKIISVEEKNTKRIKRIVWDRIQEISSGEPRYENIGYIKHPDGSILGMLHDDPLILGDMICEASDLVHSRPARLRRIDTLEFVLAHHLVQTQDLKTNEFSAVILFAQSFTKIFFLNGPYIESVLPTIQEGSDSDVVCHTAVSKTLFELDSGSIPELHNIFLAGDTAKLDAKTYFIDHMPDVKVDDFTANTFEFAPKLSSHQALASAYSVPITLALKTLQQGHTPYELNFLPHRIQEKTTIYRLTWHSLLVLALCFGTAFFLTFQTIKKGQQITSEKQTQHKLDSELETLSDIGSQVDSLTARIDELKENTALIDSMTKYTTRWSPLMETFSEAYKELGPFALTRFNTNGDDKVTAELVMQDRKQVALMERFIQKSTVSTVFSDKESDNFITVTLECKVNRLGQNN